MENGRWLRICNSWIGPPVYLPVYSRHKAIKVWLRRRESSPKNKKPEKRLPSRRQLVLLKPCSTRLKLENLQRKRRNVHQPRLYKQPHHTPSTYVLNFPYAVDGGWINVRTTRKAPYESWHKPWQAKWQWMEVQWSVAFSYLWHQFQAPSGAVPSYSPSLLRRAPQRCRKIRTREVTAKTLLTLCRVCSPLLATTTHFL